jgi:hypothetical protein
VRFCFVDDLLVLAFSASCAIASAEPWARHTIDAMSRGADGVRLADANHDGRLDIVTPWEEGGVVRLYVNPGVEAVSVPWPAVTIGRVSSPEDAVMVDLDGDGAMDVVSSCEGETRAMYVHWGPAELTALLDPDAWRTEPLPASVDRAQWMFCLPFNVDDRNGIDLVAGSKNEGAEIGWFESPRDPRRLDRWTWHSLRRAGWIMSIRGFDVDADGTDDIVFSDRRGDARGCFWIPKHKPDAARLFGEARGLGFHESEVMFLDCTRILFGVTPGIAVAISGDRIGISAVPGSNTTHQTVQTIGLPDWAGTGKAVAFGDVDLDGHEDIVVTCEHATGKSGVLWFRRTGDEPSTWEPRDVSGREGVKFDLVELVDLDGDEDLDLLTCEETDNLGVVWYENPARRR